MKTPNFWSYTRWSQYSKCPQAYYHSAVRKIRAPANKAMERGTDIHRKAEFFLRGKIKGVPDELMNFKNEFNNLKKAEANPEAGIGLTKDWKQCHLQDWDNCWLRAIADADVVDSNEIVTIDFKTGRVYPEHKAQGHLLATAKLAVMAHVDAVHIEFWYLDSGETQNWRYDRNRFSAMKSAWNARALRMLSDTEFAPTPGAHCSRCQYRNDRLGSCTAWQSSNPNDSQKGDSEAGVKKKDSSASS